MAVSSQVEGEHLVFTKVTKFTVHMATQILIIIKSVNNSSLFTSVAWG